MFAITSTAAKQIQQAAVASAAGQMALRVAAKIDADGSLQYGMGFDEPKEQDLKLDLEGVAVVIGGQSQALLMDTVLDFVELQPGEFNFIFMDASHPSCAEGAPDAGVCSSSGYAGCPSQGALH